MEKASFPLMNSHVRQILRFIVVGMSAVAVDCLLYFILIPNLDPNIAKLISYICGMIIAFLLNKYWTFEKKQHAIIQFYKFTLLYVSTLGVNVGVNFFILTHISSITLVGFTIATAASTIINFTIQKWWVFKK
ncbi:MAG: GtrA family protein [Bacillota bacterium]|uniref:GtrA family protein n=1 Tax=Virgibacillus salarius TaxID=447199 RepID=A0A941ICE2_9BACI|nr:MULTISPECIES: GtrA family protein [Bacillaceae]MBR7797401.1 GtrA family protein [Virgibacillus salarius]NAZ10111.1 GtrA family protein [Agaribacter marinus]WBX81421.1 GtrA family protein [Virgibacillus salarius]